MTELIKIIFLTIIILLVFREVFAWWSKMNTVVKLLERKEKQDKKIVELLEIIAFRENK